jgi:hypothetical protein
MRTFAITLIVGLMLPLSGAAQDISAWEAHVGGNACTASIYLGELESESTEVDLSPRIHLLFAILHPSAVNPYQDIFQVKTGDLIMQAQVVPSFDFETESPRTVSDMRVVLESEEFPLLLIPSSDPKTTFPRYVIVGVVAERVWTAVSQGQHPKIRFKFENNAISIPIRGSRVKPIAAMLAACAETMKLEK